MEGTIIFCQACGWAKKYDEIPDTEELVNAMNNKCPDCDNFLFVKGQLKPKGVSI